MKIGVVVPDEMGEAIKRIADKRGATLSNLVRIALAEWLQDNGEQVENSKVRWGGARNDKQSGNTRSDATR